MACPPLPKCKLMRACLHGEIGVNFLPGSRLLGPLARMLALGFSGCLHSALRGRACVAEIL